MDFQLKDIMGNEIRLSLYRKPVLLSFFRYASCPFCNLRVKQLSENYHEYHNSGLSIIAFFQSPIESIRKYVTEKQEIPFPIISDPEHRIYDLYGVYTSNWGYLKGVIKFITLIKAHLKGFHLGKMEGRRTLIPADFLIDESMMIIEAFYGTNISSHIDINVIENYLVNLSKLE
jgi:peroxiredoxin